MAQVKVYYDQVGNTLTVWFGDPQAEHICEETGNEVILMKDRSGHVIGFERLNFSVPPSEGLRVAFEASQRSPWMKEMKINRPHAGATGSVTGMMAWAALVHPAVRAPCGPDPPG